ncbi:FixH family protein [Allokutzneria sp. A3M-2-11 16]|uniref:FixH family protein n=1 Tax=Allokutzneria sp. A3M-2-11 16 TaxID=2962043 RepID=UPI0020B82108|nr:FixH family protein [Allokutzneria sp. A3M-2-11 16]MCP3804066.1 FixH family protein [Allokutzneria sp. A3M-2-11 16]
MTRGRWVAVALVVLLVAAGGFVLLGGGGGGRVELNSSSARHSVRLVVERARVGTTAMEVEIAGESTVEGVRLEPVMHMGHAMPLAETAAVGPGRYRAENVLLEMTGQWEVTVVLRDSAGTERVVFPLLVS